MGTEMPEQKQPARPDPDLPQDPGFPGGSPAPRPEKERPSLEEPDSPDDPTGIDAPGSPHEPPPNH